LTEKKGKTTAIGLWVGPVRPTVFDKPADADKKTEQSMEQLIVLCVVWLS